MKLIVIWLMIRRRTNWMPHGVFITLMICSTCFGQLYAHHHELTTISLFTTWNVCFLGIDGWWLGVGWLAMWLGWWLLHSRQPSHIASQPTQPPTIDTKEADVPCCKQWYIHELVMMGIEVPETCWAYHKCNKNTKWHLVGSSSYPQ
jgi:hypothetical protein